MEMDTHEVFYDKLTYIYVEIPKFDKKENLQLLRRIMQNFYSPLKMLDPYPVSYTHLDVYKRQESFSCSSSPGKVPRVSSN